MPETLSILGRDISIYYLSWFVAIAATVVIGLFLAKDYGYSLSKAVSLTAVALMLDFLLILLTTAIYGEFNLVRSVPPLPLAYVLEAWIFKEPFRKMTDFLSPLGVTCFGLTHFGCVFPGCCHGYPSAWGIYSNVAGTVCFPIQPIEAVVSILIGATMILMIKKKWQKGYLIFWMFTLFGSTRFILEFFRDNEKIWHNVSELALHAMATFIIGVVMLLILKSFDKKGCEYERH